jgi:hypothetical protein
MNDRGHEQADSRMRLRLPARMPRWRSCGRLDSMRRLLNVGALLGEQCSKYRTMAMRFALAVAADREVGLVRQRGKQLDGVAVVRRRHFRTVLPGEGAPLGGRLGRLPELHGFDAWGKVREPYVVPIARGELGLWNTPRRATHRSDANALVRDSFTPQSNYSNDHGSLRISAGDGGLIGLRGVARARPCCPPGR